MTSRVADSDNNRIQAFTGEGQVLSKVGPAFNPFNDPQGIATDCRCNVYVADTGNDRIRKLGDPAAGNPPRNPEVPRRECARRGRQGEEEPEGQAGDQCRDDAAASS